MRKSLQISNLQSPFQREILLMLVKSASTEIGKIANVLIYIHSLCINQFSSNFVENTFTYCIQPQSEKLIMSYFKPLLLTYSFVGVLTIILMYSKAFFMNSIICII